MPHITDEQLNELLELVRGLDLYMRAHIATREQVDPTLPDIQDAIDEIRRDVSSLRAEIAGALQDGRERNTEITNRVSDIANGLTEIQQRLNLE